MTNSQSEEGFINVFRPLQVWYISVVQLRAYEASAHTLFRDCCAIKVLRCVKFNTERRHVCAHTLLRYTILEIKRYFFTE